MRSLCVHHRLLSSARKNKGVMEVDRPTEDRESLEQKNLEQEKEDQNFLLEQYTALRSEIEQASDRAFKIFAASVLVVPTGLTLGGVARADNNVLPLIKMLLPLLLLAFYAMYAAQMFSTRRAGLYIEKHIEPRLLVLTRGWESWLGGRRYAYDAQMNVAFFSLSAIYYLGTVYFAVTAKVAGNPLLRNFKEFLNFEDLPLPVPILSSGKMLFIFYALAGLVMYLLVVLVPSRQLKEEGKIARQKIVQQGADYSLRGTLEEVLTSFIADLKKKRNKDLTFLRTPFYDHGLIKSYHCHTEATDDVLKARHVRLTIGKGLRSITTVVGILTLIFLGLWALAPIYRIYHRLAQPSHISVEWMQQPHIVMVLTVVSLLGLCGMLFATYYRLIGRNIGSKIDIKFQGSNQTADGECTSYIVETSLEGTSLSKGPYVWLKHWFEAKAATGRISIRSW
jgi:hypothetical protein